jgi:hypothetical protein
VNDKEGEPIAVVIPTMLEGLRKLLLANLTCIFSNTIEDTDSSKDENASTTTGLHFNWYNCYSTRVCLPLSK